jgi:hypothetical protein
MKEYTVVGPTKAQPRLLRSLLIVVASRLVVCFVRVDHSRVVGRDPFAGS